jgi:hypothetical protein
MKTINLIFIGEEFYFKSGSIMSSLYTTTGDRYDWGFVTIALEKGKTVNIRPATKEEKLLFKGRLYELSNNL